MISQPLSLEVSPSVGSVSAEYLIPKSTKCILTLAHGAGAGMNHSFMITLAKSLAEENIATLRFNFPFIENKKKRADVPAVAHKTIETAINHTSKSFSSIPLFASGKSFGGRMSSQYLSDHEESKIKGIIFYGFPLHQQGKPSTERTDHLKKVKVPMLFLQGTWDALASIELMEEVCASLPLATLIKIEGADHSFKAGKQDVISILVKHTSEWIDKVIK